MKNPHFRDDHAEIVKHIAYGHIDGDNDYRLSGTNFDTVGATSLMTTVEDLARRDDNFYHPRVGGPELVQQQLQLGKLVSGKELEYAFGLEYDTYRGLHTVDHGGADAGYRADLVRFPEQHFSVACLCEKGEISPSELTRKVADVYRRGIPAAACAICRHVLEEGRRARRPHRAQRRKLFVAFSADERLELGLPLFLK